MVRVPLPAEFDENWVDYGQYLDATINAALTIWQPNSDYTIGQLAVNPSGNIVTANATFTSGATYNAANWTTVKVTTALINARSITEDKLNVPVEGTLNYVLTYDPAQAGQIKWAAQITSTAPVVGPVMTPNDSTIAVATANTAAWLAYVADNTRGPLLSITTPGVYYINDALECTNATNPLRELYLGTGVEICQLKTAGVAGVSGKAYGPWFKGSLETVSGSPKVRYFTADAPRGSLKVTLNDVTGIYGEGQNEAAGTPATDMLHPGTMLYLFSDDWIHNTGKYRNCALRRVVTVVGNTVTLDAPLYRPWTTANISAAVVVNMHPPVKVHGPGRIYHNNPWGNDTFFAGLLRFEFVDRPTVRDVTLGPGPGNGVELFSCERADVEPHTQYLLSDDAQGATPYHPLNTLGVEHYGYGILQGGANRGARIGGSAHHVRHAHTTGASPDTIAATPLKTVILASGKTNAAATQPGNCGDPEDWHVAIRTVGTWQQNIDTHEAGHNGTIEVLSPGGGTWDDTIEEATQSGVVIRCQDVTVTGHIGGSPDYAIFVYQATQTHPEYGETVLRNLRLGPTPEAVRLHPGPGTRLRMDGVNAYGAQRGLYVRTADAFTVVGQGNYFDGTGVTEDTSKALIWFDAVVTANPIDLGIDFTNYATPIKYNGAPITQDSIRLRRRIDRPQIPIVYNGTAWPTTRPLVPGGDLVLVSPDAGIAAPSWLLRGDVYKVAS